MTVARHESASIWREDNARWLLDRLDRLRLQLPRRSPESNETPEGIAAALAECESRLTARTSAMTARGELPALLHVARLLELSPFEEDLVMLALAPELDARFSRLYAFLQDDARREYATLQLALELVPGSGPDRLLAQDALLASRPLRRLRVLRCDDPASEPLLARPLRLDERVVHYLRGVDRLDARLEGIVRPVSPPLLTTAYRGIVDKTAAALAAGDRRWPVVSLVGAAALGSRDVAAAACAQVQARLRAIDLRRLLLEPPHERREIIALLSREALLSGFVYFVDADSSVEAPADATSRHLLPSLVEDLAAPLFVAARERWRSDAVTHVIRVPRPDRAEQRLLWQAALGSAAASVNGTIEHITQQFDFGPGAIAAAATLARGRAAADDVTPADVWEACREYGGLELDDLAQRLAPSYGWNDIVLPASVLAQLRELPSQVENRTHVYEDWGFGAQLGRGRGITALFAGPSGTGKTMAAEILANHLHLDLYRIDLAGVVSKYIGETEKNLRRVFDAAERSGAILFFDEADALFGSRTDVRDSHDRYANIEVNYLLQRMEAYTGLAVLATNRKSSLDAAFLRRLRFVVDFPFPSVEDRRRIWQAVFPPKAALDGVDYGFLSRLELAGGNIRSVAVNAAFLAAAEPDAVRRSITMRHIVHAAAQEYRKIERPVSIAEFGSFYPMVRP